MKRAIVAAASLALAACNANGAGAVPSAFGAQGAAVSRGANVVAACPASNAPLAAHCLALVRTDVGGGTSVSGYTPSDLQSAYELPSSKSGSGQIIAIVDAYDDPNAASDLAVYRQNFGLPACNKSNPCFAKYNEQGQQSNYPPPDSGWAVEESLDVDMASAICPLCKIILVEATTSGTVDLGKSVDEAVKLGANVVSNSYINYNGKAPFGSKHYDHPGTIITAGGGDAGYKVGEPAGYASVIAVGGTTLTTAKGSRGWAETAWSGTGSGCSKFIRQTVVAERQRLQGPHDGDVAAVADPSTGVAVYDTYPRQAAGSSSAARASRRRSSPSIYALAGNANTLDASHSLYKNASSLYDVTSGSNGTCEASLPLHRRSGI